MDISENVKVNKELELRKGIEPSKQHGFIMEDSFFSDHCQSEVYDEDDHNPNLEFIILG